MEKIEITNLLVFSFALFVTTWVKPSFTVTFAVVMLACLIVDFVKHPKKFWNIFVFGFAALPAVGLMLYQGNLLFGSSTSVSGFGFGYAEITKIFSRYPTIAVLQSLLFAIKYAN